MDLPNAIQRNNQNIINRAATITDAANGKVSYLFAAGETSTVGTFVGEFKVTYSDGSVETFPNSGFIDIKIENDLAN